MPFRPACTPKDPASGFAPSTGTVLLADFPGDRVRVDAGVQAGSEIGPHYDPLVAKLIANGPGRKEALRGLAVALADTALLGVTTNLQFLEILLAHPAVIAGEMDTRFIDRELPALAKGIAAERQVLACAAYLYIMAQRSADTGDPWTRAGDFTNWRLSDGKDEPPRKPAFMVRVGGKSHEVSVGPNGTGGKIALRIDEELVELEVSELEECKYRVSLGNEVMIVWAVLRDDSVFLRGPFGSRAATVESFLTGGDLLAATSGHLLSPMMGKIIKLNVRVGDAVKAERVLAVQESMKMEFRHSGPLGWDRYGGRVRRG